MITIRPIRPERAKAMQDHILPDENGRSTWETNGYYWGAFDNGVMVAFAGLVPSKGWHGAVFLHCSGVMPQWRGRRLQRRLIRVRLAWAKRHGMVGARTYTVIDNPASSRSLIACGFKLYRPAYRWAGENVNYWKKDLT